MGLKPAAGPLACFGGGGAFDHLTRFDPLLEKLSVKGLWLVATHGRPHLLVHKHCLDVQANHATTYLDRTRSKRLGLVCVYVV